MSDALSQIDDFRRYAEKRVAAGENRTVVELFDEWLGASRSYADREADLMAIEESLREVAAGNLGRPFDEFDREFRKRNGLT